jgi:Eco57I restriction-modification methylase
MAPLSVDLRNQLARTIQAARRAAESGARKAIESLAVHLAKAHDSMDADAHARKLRGRLRAHGKQLGDKRHPDKDTQTIDHLKHEVAYEHWHRMLFARFLSENHLLIEPTSNVAISMADCEELARERGADPWALAASFAQRMLPRIFRTDDPSLEVQLPPEARLALERHLESLPVEVFTADDALGWTYQFWQTEKKDEINRAGGEIGADELPAVTQLFTEHYMVLSLLHNTIGAWRAAKLLDAHPELAAAESEEDLRQAMRLGGLSGYDFTHLRFVREQDDIGTVSASSGLWRPAAGRFEGWPTRASELRVLDPCCGSGHFLVEVFQLLVRLRIEEESLSVQDAIRSVLATNLFGLEIDPRCTQIAAFNLALAAWRLAGHPIELAPLRIACSGFSVSSKESEWIALTAGNDRLQAGMRRIYELFQMGQLLGSLIDPRDLGGDLFEAGFRDLQQLIDQVIARSGPDDNAHEIAVTARGLAQAAEILSSTFTLVATNVPYLTQGRQDPKIRRFAEANYADAKNDLATVFFERIRKFLEADGTAAVVLPQHLLFLVRYEHLRRRLLTDCRWDYLVPLGTGAFETIGGEVVNVTLLTLSATRPQISHDFFGVDASVARSPHDKVLELLHGPVQRCRQTSQPLNPDARISLTSVSGEHFLEERATCRLGVVSGDGLRWIRKFWEVPTSVPYWKRLQGAPENTGDYLGRQDVIYWKSNGDGMLRPGSDNPVFNRRGVAVAQMSTLPATIYCGELYDNNVAAIVPHDDVNLPALWAFCSSAAYAASVRRIDKKIGVIHGSLLKVPFDLQHWQEVASQNYPNGLPKPYSDDPAQWLFHGYPACAGVGALQVAVARLVGYRWPAELDTDMEISRRGRELVRRCDELVGFAVDDGILCLPSVRGERPAADRLLSLLSACEIRPDRDLDEWLRASFFQEHCRLFRHRPFIWHVWDGSPDGFHALVNYHRLAGPQGEGRRTLEALTYSYLGDWIERQKADQRDGKDGADARLAAAQDLQAQLQRILIGEPPCDIFVRWKPLHQQPIGWTPDINDGVRLNIRPFMSAELRKGGRAGAGVLRWKPNINWQKKDRGSDPLSIRPHEEFPWFWGCSGEGSLEERTNFKGTADYDGNRWNDLHYTNLVKTTTGDGVVTGSKQ